MARSMLTTIDNPFDPFDEFDAWYAFDMEKGYDSCGLLARVALTSSELSEAWQDALLEMALDELIELNPMGIHKKVTRPDEDEQETDT